MKFVDAVWEKRNLGVTCCEVTVELGDDTSALELNLNKATSYQYAVLRVPSSRVDLMLAAQDKGYRFIEAAIELELSMKDLHIPKKLGAVLNKVEYQQMDSKDLEFCYSQIDKNIFKTDRVILDPYFTPVLAAQRYKFWTMDMVKSGLIPFKVLYYGEAVGFFINKEVKPGVYDGVLAGCYDGFEGTGMGVCVQYAGLKRAQLANVKKFIGHVSANNPDVLKALEGLGYKVKKIEYVLIKHN